ncbi:hypothetical protein CGZ96_15755 [Enemella evansiae]|uniref:VOC family protein n=1 Tax=Enemella evansiae TaxID=2016499 RepID=UPI000B9783E5|nr:VOC family protein [Enemella evansiae]OYN95932.1 hypothetical protein CGZ96_15755 [Enemella evansiae]
MPALSAITFDCQDVATQSRFWSALLDRPIDEGASEFFAGISVTHGEPTGSPGLLFLKVGSDREPAKNPVHLDLYDADLEGAAARAKELGAEQVGAFDEFGIEWVTLRDPEGNLFDIGRPSRSGGGAGAGELVDETPF